MSDNDPREWQRKMGIKPSSDDDVFGAINSMPPEDDMKTAEIPVVDFQHQNDVPRGHSNEERAERQRSLRDDATQSSAHTGDTVTKDVMTLKGSLPRLKMPLHKGLYVIIALAGAFIASLVFPLIITLPISFLFWPNIIAQEEQGRRKNAIGCFILMFASAVVLSVVYTMIITTINGIFSS